MRSQLEGTVRQLLTMFSGLKIYISLPEHQRVSPPAAGVSSIRRPLKSEGHCSESC